MSAPPTNCSFGICLPLMGSLLAALPLMAEIPFAAAVIRDGSRYLLQVPARPGELYCLEVPDVPGSMSFTSVPGTAVYAQSSTVSWPLELPGTVVLDQSAGTPSGEEPPAVGGSTLLVLTVEVADPPGSHVRLRAGGANPWTAVAPAAFPRVTFDGFADLPTANGVRCTALSARTLPEPIGESEPGRAQLSPEQQQEFDAVMAGFPQLIAAATLPPGLPPASGTPPTSPLTSSRYFRVAMYRVDTNGNGYADADELAIGSNPFARPGEPGFLPAASSADGTATPGIAPIWDTDGDFSPDFEEIAAGTSPLLKYSAPVVLTCQKLDRWAIFNSAGSWREYEERFHGWEPGWRNPIHPEMLSGSPISMDPATTPRTLSGFMSDFAAGWSEFDVPSPDARKGLPPQSLFGEYWKLPPLIARSVSPGAGNPPATNGYIRAIGDRYRLRGPLSQVTQQRQFIKATWTQTEGFNQSHVPEYAAETLMEQPPASTEVITLTIPAGALYSPPYDVTPDAPDTPHTNVSDYLKVVRLLPVEFEIKHTEIDPATGQVVNPGANTMLRDEIVDIKIKVPPIGTTDWTVDLTVEPQAMRNENLPNRGSIQMYDFGQVETNGTVTPDKTQFVLQASAGGERNIKAVFNKEGTLKIKMKSTDGKIDFTSPDYTIQKRMRKYASLPSSQSHDLNQHDKAFEDAAKHWGGVYQHQVDDVERLKAMGMAESELGLTDATDILTVGNPGDHVLDTFRNVAPYDRLPGVSPLGGLALREVDIANNSTRMLSYLAADETPAATAIHWGVCWLYQKASSIQNNPNPQQPQNPYVPGPWRSWDTATERYNGGGVTNYLQRINRSMKEGRHPSNANLYIWPLKSNKKARGNQ